MIHQVNRNRILAGIVLLTCAIICYGEDPEITRLIKKSGAMNWESAEADIVAREGSDVRLNVQLTSAESGDLAWYFNGTALEGETNSTLTITNLTRGDDGLYIAQISNFTNLTRITTRIAVVNVQPKFFAALIVTNEPEGSSITIRSKNSLSDSNWLTLTNFAVSEWRVFVPDKESASKPARFYESSGITPAQVTPTLGWDYDLPIGSIVSIDYVTNTAGIVWQQYAVLTITNGSGSVVLDPRISAKGFRTTLLSIPGATLHGRLLYSMRWLVGKDVVGSLSPSTSNLLAQAKVKIDDDSLQFPNNILSGYWVAVGDQRVMTDTNGNFEIDVPPGAHSGYVLRQFSDRLADAVHQFDPSEALAKGGVSEIVVQYLRSGSFDMDPPPTNNAAITSTVARLSAQCDTVCGKDWRAIGNSGPWCLDYDGPLGNGCKYYGWCDADLKIAGYMYSTCYKLILSKHCDLEANAYTLSDVIHNRKRNNVYCWENHKYRNCQTVDDDFWIGPSEGFGDIDAVTGWGASLTLTVHNNTWANETSLFLEQELGEVTSPGSIDSDVAGSMPNSATIFHYANGVHLVDKYITYRAPEDWLGGPDSKYVTIIAKAGAQEKRFRILLLSPGGN